MAVWIQILSGANEPIYSQIVEQIRQAIAKGQLGTGEKLPAVRKLASVLVVNPNTVAKAYTILEQAGMVATKSGSGTFIADPKMRTSDPADINVLAERMDAIIGRAINLGINRDDLIKMFNDRVNTFVDNERGHK
ncbi:MAG: GntR family transcriptional regulator [Phycisphaerae bacterium]|jgi:GntR family transcriptional regulator